MTMSQNKIYVGNLSFDTIASDLEEFFSQYGKIVDTKLIKDRDTDKSKGFGFITFDTQKGAQASLAADGTELKGRRIKVNMARDDSRRSGGGGGGGGRSQGTNRW
jgi:cold-inducible RNA-binding protein